MQPGTFSEKSNLNHEKLSDSELSKKNGGIIRPKGIFFFETFWANSSGGFEGSETFFAKKKSSFLSSLCLFHFLFHFPFHILSSFSSCLFSCLSSSLFSLLFFSFVFHLLSSLFSSLVLSRLSSFIFPCLLVLCRLLLSSPVLSLFLCLSLSPCLSLSV